MSIYVLEFERPDEWISANARDHHFTKAAKTRAWRAAAAVHARAAHIPRLEQVTILAEPMFTNARHRDSLNIADTIKACVDGIALDAGVLVSDCDCHVLETTVRRGPTVKGIARLRITITEVGA
jgi:dihydroxyacid dehydratase/phosphogluconate dehydratase